ncbi:hypothetical protein KHC17_28155 (plasmid) [Agrobacterium salinitolerans]|uniref:hypothetical protein n=1 Tax=Agrobacterium salinitolerans TaxID=1183413 RepID=UPI001C21345C|nr:hypothetical protein [Agrobacterium salinitolerans]QXC52983.1 hypothetical protein KHC17_28155 [Agrobacterium salinitolerans]
MIARCLTAAMLAAILSTQAMAQAQSPLPKFQGVSEDCDARLYELRNGFGPMQVELMQVSQKGGILQREVGERTAELLFFEGELGNLGRAIENFKAMEGPAKAGQNQIERRIDYLFTLPPSMPVLNEINILQNHQMALMNDLVALRQRRSNLEIVAITLRKRVGDAREHLVEREADLRELGRKQFELNRTLTNTAAEIEFLSSLVGQNACSEAELAQTQGQLAEKQKLMAEIESLQGQATEVLTQSQVVRDKIEGLMSQLDI